MRDPLTDAQVAELERLLGEATPGEWYWDSYSTIAVGCEPGGPFDASKDDAEEAPLGRQIVATVENVPGTHGDQLHHPQLRANARLIVAAINALPALLAERRALRAAVPSCAECVERSEEVAGLEDFAAQCLKRAEQAEAERDRLRAALAGMIEWLDSEPVRSTFERMGGLSMTHPHLAVAVPMEFRVWAAKTIQAARDALAPPPGGGATP